MTRSIPDSEILKLIEAGLIRIGSDLSVWKMHSVRRTWHKLHEDRSEPGRVKFNVRVGKRQRKIHRARLQWLCSRRSLVPDGMVIDHEDLDSMNDRPENLRLMKAGESHRQGNGIQISARVEEVVAYFDCLIFLGREPGWALEEGKSSESL